MNTNILKKCVEELKKKDFSKEYVMGMLETLIEMHAVQTYTTAGYMAPIPIIPEEKSNNPPVITGFKDLQQTEKNESTKTEERYLNGGIGRV